MVLFVVNAYYYVPWIKHICSTLCHVVDLYNASIPVLCFMTYNISIDTVLKARVFTTVQKRNSHRHCLNIHKKLSKQTISVFYFRTHTPQN